MLLNSRICRGVVVDTIDLLSKGVVTCTIPEISKVNRFQVTYTSPYYNISNGGFLAIPEVGSDVLIFCSLENGVYYYISTIVSFQEGIQKGGLRNQPVIADKYVYTNRAKPQRLTFTDAYGNGIAISSRTTKEFISAKVDLNSRGGKRITLSDSPKSDMVMIRNEHGDGMIITSDPNEIHSERAIEIKSKGAMKYICFQSEILISLIEGRDITIENQSNGSNSMNGINGPKSGNINIRSTFSDINIVTKGDSGRVFIVTPNARVQITADGSVLIDSTKKVQIHSTDVSIYADNSFNVEATNVNIKANGNLMLEGNSLASVKTSGQASIDGTTLHLNSGLSQSPTINTAENLNRTDYEE